MLNKIVAKKRTLMRSLACLAKRSLGKSTLPLDVTALKSLYSAPLPKPDKPLNVYHLGHSLVGRDMPSMLKQIAGDGHEYRSQLGWGATLKSHWEPSVAISGFEKENAHAHYQDVFEAIDAHNIDAFVLTEMVEIKDAIKYFDSAKYLAKFARYISEKSPKTRIYLYESWHHVNDEQGWIHRLANDYPRYWLTEIVDRAIRQLKGEVTIYVIPVGQVLSRLFKEASEAGSIGNLTTPEDIFAKTEEGELDSIHINDLGWYIVAVTHYAVLYQRSPEGLPYQLQRADGGLADAPTPEAAKLIQQTAWEVVAENYRTGLCGY